MLAMETVWFYNLPWYYTGPYYKVTFFSIHIVQGFFNDGASPSEATLQDMGKIDQYQTSTKHNKAWCLGHIVTPLYEYS